MRLLLILLLFVFSNSSWSWGKKGHEIVAYIAQSQLQTDVQVKLRKLLKGQSLVEVSNWADWQRRNKQTSIGNTKSKDTGPWHYINLTQLTDFQLSKPGRINHILDAIYQAIGDIEGRTEGTFEQTTAVKLLVHFVADVHQPLHVGLKQDLGGNKVEVILKNDKTNLHSFWDSKVINSTKLSAQSYANELLDDKALISDFKIGSKPEDWMKESFDLRKDVYDFKGKVMTKAYQQNAKNVIDKRLLWAGLRLGQLLNQLIK